VVLGQRPGRTIQDAFRVAALPAQSQFEAIVGGDTRHDFKARMQGVSGTGFSFGADRHALAAAVAFILVKSNCVVTVAQGFVLSQYRLLNAMSATSNHGRYRLDCSKTLPSPALNPHAGARAAT